MKRFILCVSAMLLLYQGAANATGSSDDKQKKKAKKVHLLRELSAYAPPTDSAATEIKTWKNLSLLYM